MLVKSVFHWGMKNSTKKDTKRKDRERKEGGTSERNAIPLDTPFSSHTFLEFDLGFSDREGKSQTNGAWRLGGRKRKTRGTGDGNSLFLRWEER